MPVLEFFVARRNPPLIYFLYVLVKFESTLIPSFFKTDSAITLPLIIGQSRVSSNPVTNMSEHATRLGIDSNSFFHFCPVNAFRTTVPEAMA